MDNGTATQGGGGDPSGFLSEIIGNPVTVKLNSGVVYKGIWASLLYPAMCPRRNQVANMVFA